MLHADIILLSLATVLPACSLQQISYKEDVHPILDNNCNGCHGAPDGSGYQASGLKLDSHHSLMQGTIYGPVVIAGDSRRSILNKLVEGRAGNLQKTLHKDGDDGISKEETETLKVWVDEGALDN